MKYFLLLLLLLLSNSISAKVVSLKDAQAEAEKIWERNTSRSSSNNLHFAWDNRALSKNIHTRSNSLPCFYVFAGNDNRGFVIVSAEDQIMPILAYSFNDNAPQTDYLPQSLTGWFNNVCQQIEYVRGNDIRNDNANKKRANAKTGKVVIELETAKWNQDKPYNNQCPVDGQKRSLAGCTIVATAIVMKYHNWPKAAHGYCEAYTTKTKGIFVEGRDLNHEYEWKKMPLIYSRNKYTEEQANAVSTLMVDIGSAFQADFTNDWTSSTLDIKKLYEHFGYNPSMSQIPRVNYSDEKWLALLKTELNALRPVLYSGHGNSGHQFVLDGFTDDDFFHVNWGWGGQCNGYYTLSNLVPDDRGGYNDNQWACLNVKPNTTSEVEDWIKFRTPGIELTQTAFEQNHRYRFDRLCFINNAAIDFVGTLRGAVTNRKGEIKEWITVELNQSLQGGGWYVNWEKIDFTIKNKINIGDRIRFFYKREDSNNWYLIKSDEKECRWEVPIADELYICESTSFSFNRKNRIITIQTKDGVNVSLFNTENEATSIGLSSEGNIINIDTKELSSGEYTIRLQKGDDNKQLKFSVKSL